MVYLIMGVSGCGKTTVGKLLSERLRIDFYDADDFHPQENIRKMKGNIPLDDSDRKPWLIKLASHIAQWNKEKGAVLACSALKENYRRILSGNGEEKVIFIYLKGDKKVILQRLKERKAHFFPSGLMESQFSALEIPEGAVTVDISMPPESICDEIMNRIEAENLSV